MPFWFSEIEASCELSAGLIHELRDVGLVIIPGPVAPDRMAHLCEAYDSAVAGATKEDVSVGSSTTRVNDFVNRGPDFDPFYVHEPALKACCSVIGHPFRLSTMHARTVRPYIQAQNLHVDFASDVDGWPMLGFIVMVDEFRTDNGATRFVPGSHKWTTHRSTLRKTHLPT